MVRHLNDETNLIIKSRSGNIDLRRPLKAAEKQWILNERAMCSISCEYYLTRYYMIASESETGASNIMHFTFRSGQRVFWRILQKLDTPKPGMPEGASKEVFCLKARKQGISTLIEGILSWMSTCIPGTKAAIASADGQKSQIMAGMFFFAIDELPWWLESTRTRDKRASDRGIIEWSHIGNQVILQSGSMRGGIGQGTTPNAVHISECISAHTLIRGENSSLIPMSELKNGDKILGANGEVISVLRHWKTSRNNEMTAEIEMWGNSTPLSCTRDHKVLLERGWTEAKDVVSGDMIVYPVRTIVKNSTISMLSIEKYKHRKKGANCQTIQVEPSFQMGRIAGLYLAEGSILRGRFTAGGIEKRRISGVSFALDKDETEEVREWLTEAGFDGWTSKTLHRENSRTSVLHTRHRGLAEWLLEHFGEKDSKTIPDACWGWGKEFCEGLVWGYLYGDGHFPEYNTVTAISIRPAILFGLREMVASLGYGWSQISWRPAGSWYKRNCQATWKMDMSGTVSSAYRKSKNLPFVESNGDGQRWRYDEGRLLLEVSANKSGFTADFYDLEVDHAEHAFTTACGVVHNCSQFTNAIQQIDEGLLKAVTSNPGTFMVLETTGDGDVWTAKMWHHCKENYWKGKARLLPLFLPWFMSPELYPSKSWMAKYPIPKGWEPMAETRAMASKCRAYVASTEVLREELGKDWQLPRDAQWWWEFNFVEHKQRGIEKSFLRQHPCDDFEALIGEQDSAVGADAIENMQRTVTNDVVGVYQIAGDGIETKHEPNRELIIHGDDALRLYSEWKNHKEASYEWGFIPVEGALAEQAWNPLKKCIIWEEPRPWYIYGIGVDTGTGAGLDRSTIIVTRKGMDDDEPDVQVAEFADDTIGQTDLWAWVAAITALYSRYYETDIMPAKRHPKLCIELRRKVGDMTFNQLYHSLNFKNHNWFVALDKTTFKPKPGNTGRPGFFTNAWSRPLLLGFFTSSVENGWYEVKSRFLQAEMKNAKIKAMASGRSRMDHASGEHDDRIFGAAQSHWTLHDIENLADWSKRRYQAPAARDLVIDYSPAGMMAVNCGEDWLSSRVRYGR